MDKNHLLGQVFDKSIAHTLYFRFSAGVWWGAVEKTGGIMKRVLLGILAAVFALVPVAQIAQAEADHSSADLVIYQAYFGSPIDATDEFMVLHNTSLAAVDISGLVVEEKFR